MTEYSVFWLLMSHIIMGLYTNISQEQELFYIVLWYWLMFLSNFSSNPKFPQMYSNFYQTQFACLDTICISGLVLITCVKFTLTVFLQVAPVSWYVCDKCIKVWITGYL